MSRSMFLGIEDCVQLDRLWICGQEEFHSLPISNEAAVVFGFDNRTDLVLQSLSCQVLSVIDFN